MSSWVSFGCRHIELVWLAWWGWRGNVGNILHVIARGNGWWYDLFTLNH